MAFRSWNTLHHKRDDLDHADAMVALFDYYGYEPNLPEDRWLPVNCLNPEHEDEHESASVHPILGGYRCHGCGISGDAFKVLMTLENVNFKQALEILDARAPEPVEGEEWL